MKRAFRNGAKYVRNKAEAVGGPPILIFVAAIAVAIGGPRWLEVTAAIATALGGVWASYQQVRDARLLSGKNEELKALAMRTADAVTGGSSVCYLMPYGRIGPTALVIPLGEFPLYDVVVRVTDLDVFAAIREQAIPMPNFIAAEVATIRIGEMAPTLSRLLSAQLFLLHGERRSWNVFFTARNGNWTQLIRMKQISGGWKMATKVLRSNGRDVAFEEIEPGYPRMADSGIEW